MYRITSSNNKKERTASHPRGGGNITQSADRRTKKPAAAATATTRLSPTPGAAVAPPGSAPARRRLPRARPGRSGCPAGLHLPGCPPRPAVLPGRSAPARCRGQPGPAVAPGQPPLSVSVSSPGRAGPRQRQRVPGARAPPAGGCPAGRAEARPGSGAWLGPAPAGEPRGQRCGAGTVDPAFRGGFPPADARVYAGVGAFGTRHAGPRSQHPFAGREGL